MKKNGKLFILLMLFSVALSAGFVSARTVMAADIGVTLNGKKLSLGQPPVIVNGRVLVPFRGIAEALGAKVSYDSATKKIGMTKGSTTVELTVGSRTAKVSGKSVTLDVAPSIINGNTMVPVRFISEALGVKVNWTGSVVELSDSGGKAASGSFSQSDLSMTIEGKSWGLMQDGKPLITALGKNGKLNTSESESCAFEGMDKLYSNSDCSVSVIPINGKNTEIIDEIILKSSKYSTSKGIKVGATKQSIIDTYGDGYTTAGSVITYWAGEKNGLKTPRLYFQLSGSTVKEIGIYGGRNAG